MKTIKHSIIKGVALAVCFMGVSASALTLTPTTPYYDTGTKGNPKLSHLGSRLYDADPKKGESGMAKDWYDTAFRVPADKPASATISWLGDAFISSNPVYVLIKDGNLPWYVYNISGWDGMEDIVFQGYYQGKQGKISHISIIGGSILVPDGGTTAILLGLGLLALSLMRFHSFRA